MMTLPERVAARYAAAQLPKILKIVFGAVFLGASKALTIKVIEDEDWDDLAERLADDEPADLKTAIVTKFYADVRKNGLRGLDKVIEAPSTVEHLSARLSKGLPYSGVLDGVQIDDNDRGEVEIQFEVWAGEADPDNYDEKANFDTDIDDAILAITGPIRVSHVFERNEWNGQSFVHKFRGKWSYDAASLIKANMHAVVEAAAAKATGRFSQR
jgi:hypothetical protein